MDITGQSHLLNGLLFSHAEDQHGIGGGDVQHAGNSVQGSLGGIQHGSGGDGRAGQGLNGAAFLHVDTNKLLGLVRRQPAGTEAGGL